jgi:hypothetical protein
MIQKLWTHHGADLWGLCGVFNEGIMTLLIYSPQKCQPRFKMAHSSLKAPTYGAREPLSAWARRFTMAARTAKRCAAPGRLPGSLMKDEDRPLQIAGEIRTIFPRMKSQELFSALMQAAFKLVSVHLGEEKDQSMLTDRKGVRKRLTVSGLAARVGMSRAARHSAWRKKVPEDTIGDFLRHLEGVGQAPSAKDRKSAAVRRFDECENS